MPKFRDYFRQMLAENEELFSEFAQIHREYEENQNDNQEEFNAVGMKVNEVLREWEGKLCGYSEKGEYGKYSAKLAEKFREEVKAYFPLIDFVGVEVSGGALKLKKAKPVVKVEETVEVKVSKVDFDPDIDEIEKFVVLEDDLVVKKLL